jgi:hypothetical protein
MTEATFTQADLKLLREHEVAPLFRRAMRARGEAVIAVAFWGKGAAALLGLETGAMSESFAISIIRDAIPMKSRKFVS